MTLVSPLQVFLAGLAGGCLLEMLHWHALRREPEFPAYARTVRYWIVTVLMALSGGGLALLYFGVRAEGMVAVHVGLSTPLILQKLAATAFEPKGARSSNATIWKFFRW